VGAHSSDIHMFLLGPGSVNQGLSVFGNAGLAGSRNSARSVAEERTTFFGISSFSRSALLCSRAALPFA